MNEKNSATAKEWAHQAYEFKVGRDKRSRALIWPMRSGKSRACLRKAIYQYGRDNIEGIVIIAPNGVHLNWIYNEVPKWVPIHCEAFAWETQKRAYPEKVAAFEEMLTYGGLKIIAINMEALKHLDCRRDLKRFLAACHRKFFLIVSEAHHFGHTGSRRTYFARSLAMHAAYVQTETGTPILNGPLRAFSQYELLGAGALGFKTYREFEKHYAEYELRRRGGRNYPTIAGYKNLDELREHVARWTSLVLREEIHDMPTLIRTERPVVMTDKCRRVYLEMVARHLAEIGDSIIEAPDGGPRMMKLQQILHGYLVDSDTGNVETIDEEASIYRALADEIEGTFPGKVLIWCRYHEDIRRVMRYSLRSGNAHFLEYHGRMSAAKREANRKRFLDDPKIDGIIGTPDTGGEGLDFSAADAVIFFSIPPNALMISQAQERATVKGGKPVSMVRIRHYGTVDDRLWDIVDGNISLADTITGHGLRDLLQATNV